MGRKSRERASRQRSVDRARRKVLGYLLKAAGLGATIAASGFFGKPFEDAWDAMIGSGMPAAPLSPQELATYRFGFINDRFLTFNGTTGLVSGDLNVRVGKPPIQPHLSHDRRALSTIRALRRVRECGEETIEICVEETDSLICSGSPVANDISGEYLPVVGLDPQGPTPVRTRITPARIPYHFATGFENMVKVRSGAAAGAIVSKRNNAIIDLEGGHVIRRPDAYTDGDGFLATDYLLLSRLPRNASGGEILIIAGLHGPATQAFELLFSPQAFPDSELRHLEQFIGDEPYFQVVFEVFDIAHSAPMSVARRIRVSRLVPPRIVRFTPDFFAPEAFSLSVI